jgi:hypothetical protein
MGSAARGALSTEHGERNISWSAFVLSAVAIAILALMLSELYRQLPAPAFSLLALAAIWLGIASLFSP